jgi:hypothetical protein
MKKFLFIIFFLVLCFRVSAQRFSQYNTGTLYDGFENPAQRTFTPDSSRKFAFNLFIPNFNADVTLMGNVQAALKQRAFLRTYDDSKLTIGKGNINRANINFGGYSVMAKLYTSLNGDQEIGVFAQSKFEARGVFTDESIQMFADNTGFKNQDYDNIFNNRYNYQAYHQFGVTYRENVNDQFALGIKLSGLLGIIYNKVNVNESHITFDRANDLAYLSMHGNYYASFEPGKFTSHDILPTFKNPGAAISLGATYLTDEKIKLQWNLKDLGFIHWNKKSVVGEFNNTAVINGLSERGTEDSIYNATEALVQQNGVRKSFTTPTDARFEFSAAKTYWVDGISSKYTPTLILSKELFYTGFTAAMVNHVQYNNFVATATFSYDDMKQFNLGGQLMIKSPNAEFFIGCDRLPQTAVLASNAISKPSSYSNSAFSGANFFMGFSLKIGQVIEHRENASTIPMGERGFLARLWGRLFKTSHY